MFLALAELTQDTSERTALLRSAEETITDFRRIATGMAVDHAAFGVSDGLSPWLSAMMAVDRESFDHVVSTFTDGSLRILTSLKRGGQDVRCDVIKLSRFVATILLDRMNKLVADFASELNDVANREEAAAEATADERRSTQTSQTSIIDLTDELNRVNMTVNIISLNATIQAAQAGEAGKGFGVIAVEIQKLSGQIKALTSDIRRALSSS